MRRGLRALHAALLSCAVGGCVTPPPAEPPTPVPAAVAPAPPVPSPATAAEQSIRGRAEAYAQQRLWADALVQWELLVLLRPDEPEYRERTEEVRRRIAATAEQFIALAEQARRSGNLERASVEYLRALNVDRHNARAVQGLREIERERNRRNYLNRPPRNAM